ncbi:MAG: ABC transporter permease [Clostridium lundense]|nr:ABC transporter permease [Clostridium lundense]
MNKQKILKASITWMKNLIILLVVPIFFTFVFGKVYSKTFVEKIPMVVMDEDNSSISRSIIKQFSESEGFQITKYVDSENELKEIIDRKKAYVGLVIPKDFQKYVKEMSAPKTLFIVDQTNLVIGNNAFAYGSEILNTLNAGVQLNVLEGKGMNAYTAEKAVTSLSFTQRVLYDPQISYMKYLMFGIIGIILQQTFLEVLAPMLIDDKKKLLEIKFLSIDGLKYLGRVTGRILVISLCALLQFTACSYIVGKYFNLPLRGIVLHDYILALIFILNLIAICFVLAAIFKEVLPCVQLCLFISIPAILTCGYVWPEFMMPKGLYKIVNTIWPLGSFINPLRDINLKGTDLQGIYKYIESGLRYTAIWLPIGIGLYAISIAIDKFLKNKQLGKLEKGELTEPNV